MALLTKAPRGTQDFLPADTAKLRFIEATALETAALYGFKEIRTPTFEHTELFDRSVGDTTDVVQKEMYTFTDKGGRSITLRPEGTAGIVRCVMEHGLINDALPLKTCYILSCFRYEKPQAGRWREFSQFGVEMFGPAAPDADAEVIALAREVITTLGVSDITLKLNSIGCPTCRAEYHKALKEYFAKNAESLCETCRGRMDKNPMRILDCKSPVCSEIAAGAPKVLDYICDDCKAHFEGVKTRLTGAGIAFEITPTLVRGLDYYTNTVFEFVSNAIGAQGTVCGGGRYNGLVEALGGSPTPALGFGMGIGRLMLVMEAAKSEYPQEKGCDIYLAPLGESAKQRAFELVKLLRAEGFAAETDLMGRSLKAQMKYADKLGATYTLVVGDSELEQSIGKLKNMKTGAQTDVPLSDSLIPTLYNLTLAEAVEDLSNTGLEGFNLNLLK